MQIQFMDKWDSIGGLTEQVRADLRVMEKVFTPVGGTQMVWQDESDPVEFFEPIVAKKDCQIRIDFAEAAEWKVKETVPGHAGEVYKAAKLTLTITDPDVQTEHAEARPRLVIEHQFNVERYPYLDKKSGGVRWLGRTNLYQLEEAFGFSPVFTNGDGQPIEAFVTRDGRKVAPKGENIKRQINPDFAQAYFQADGTVNPENWIEKAIYADVDVEKSEQYGDRNIIKRFKVAPVSV